MTFEGKWQLNTGQFTINTNSWDREILTFQSRWWLIEVTAITGLTVYNIRMFNADILYEGNHFRYLFFDLWLDLISQGFMFRYKDLSLDVPVGL